MISVIPDTHFLHNSFISQLLQSYCYLRCQINRQIIFAPIFDTFECYCYNIIINENSAQSSQSKSMIMNYFRKLNLLLHRPLSKHMKIRQKKVIKGGFQAIEALAVFNVLL